MEGNDEYHEERIDALKTEVERFYDNIINNFSIYHIAGYRDPNDKEMSEKLSEEDGEEWKNLLSQDF